jgi:phosphoglycolate phosphatase
VSLASPSVRRLVLWDIDGTLLTGGPVAREVFESAVAGVLARPPGDHGVRMSGKTDPQIALEILDAAGVPREEALRVLPQVLQALEEGLAEGLERIRTEGRVHPGVQEVLERLHATPGVLQSLLTGNLLANARVKVRAFGLDRFLDIEVGAYGSDHHDREELVPFALRRVERRHGSSLEPGDAWIVGDTPRDLACARAGGARCLLVGTGRHPYEELRDLPADAVLPDLSDAGRVIDLLLG